MKQQELRNLNRLVFLFYERKKCGGERTEVGNDLVKKTFKDIVKRIDNKQYGRYTPEGCSHSDNLFNRANWNLSKKSFSEKRMAALVLWIASWESRKKESIEHFTFLVSNSGLFAEDWSWVHGEFYYKSQKHDHASFFFGRRYRLKSWLTGNISGIFLQKLVAEYLHNHWSYWRNLSCRLTA